MFTLFCFVLLACTSMVESSKSVFILAGQSNMAGKGGVDPVNRTWDGIVPLECEADPQILRLNAGLTWEEAREPLHDGIDPKNVGCGIGLWMAFSNLVLKRDASVGEIGLVPCAVGGTSLSQWMRGSQYYNKTLTRARAAVADGGGVIEAMLWYQGENDANSATDAMPYKGRLEQFLIHIRSDLQLPSLPVIQVALASGGRPEFRERVRNAQIETATELPNVKCVDAKGLQRGPDRLHLTSSAQVRLGQMLADAFLQKS